MKHSRFLFAAAVLVIASASCQKEEPAHVVSDSCTFAATIGDQTKLAISDDGKCSWSVGDVVIVYNGNNSGNVAIADGKFTSENIQTISVTSEMLSNDNRTLTFTTDLAEPSGSNWYLYAAHSVPTVYMIRSNGSIISGAINETLQTQIPFLAMASVSKTATDAVNFKHVVGWLKMTVSAWKYKVEIKSNDSENPIVRCVDTAFSGSDLNITLRGDVKPNLYNCKVNDASPNKYFYAALMPDTWGSGISFSIYSGSSTLDKTVPAGKSFKVEAGHVYNTGDLLGDHGEKDTYYEMWEAGQSIQIGGVNYSKSSPSGLTAVHLTETVTLTAADCYNKIFFIDPSASVTISNRMDNTVFVGNKIGQRTVINVPSDEVWMCATNAKATLHMFKNVEFNRQRTTGRIAWLRDKGASRIVYDNCKMNMQIPDIGGVAWTTPVDEFNVTDCDIALNADNLYLLSSGNCAKLVVKNNVFYAPSSNHMISNLLQVGERGAGHSLRDTDVDIENNSFINLRGNGNSPAIIAENYSAATVSNNLLIYEDGSGLPNNLFILGNWNGCTAAKQTINSAENYIYDTATSTANSFISHWTYYSGNNFQGGWINRNTAYGLTANPYTTMDLDSGTFVNTSTYGAKR